MRLLAPVTAMANDDADSAEGRPQVEKKTLGDLTNCRQCLTLTLSVPKNCRLSADVLASRVQEMFDKDLFSDLCSGCPLEKIT